MFETLPNLDINIKCANSLISRFPVDVDLKEILKKTKWNIETYRLAVATYRDAKTKEEKREMERLINQIKSEFKNEMSATHPKIKKLHKLSGDLAQMTRQNQFFEMTEKRKRNMEQKSKTAHQRN